MSLKPILVVIMDGFGLSEEKEGNAVYSAKTPNLDRIFNTCPFSKLEASGLKVGLPGGQMGNSEVGHTNIGAGRVVFQDLTYIDRCISDGSFFENKKLLSVIKHVRENNAALHLMGLVSDGFVHSSINHLYALLHLAAKHGVKNTFIHVWTDGRDTAPDAAKKFVFELENFTKKLGVGEVKTVCGRFYSMDRDKRWERTDSAFDAMVFAKAEKEFESAEEYITSSYLSGVTDEFLVPAVKKGYQGMKENDAVVCFNFRADRARQISKKILDSKKFKYFGFTQYYPGVPHIFGARRSAP